ncbi:MAG TPA: hypothetical protein VGR20_02095, partial [Acidimicrobiia bacterium]|nr:hypothetical protein [Acidimicrobiia bacterium]
MSDLILTTVRLCVLAVFATLATRSYRRWRHGGGGEAAAWLGASFTVLALVTMAGIVFAGQGQGQGRWPWKLTAAVLLLFPYCLSRFTASFRPAPRRLLTICGGVTALVIGWTLAMPAPHQGHRPALFGAYMVVVLAEWTVFSLLAAGWLWSSARAEVSVARRRMRTLAAGSLLVNVAILTRALALPSAPQGAKLAVQVFGLVGAWLFFAGFTPPRSLRRLWRQEELAGFHRAQAELITASDEQAVGRVIVAQAVQLFGAKAAFMMAADGRILASQGIDTPEAVVLAAGTEPGVVKVPLRGGWLAVQASRATPFFGLDENELLQSLCDSAGLALERAELLDRDRQNRDALQQRENQLAQAQRLARLGSWEWHVDTGRVVWSAEMYRIADMDPIDID